MLGDTLLPARYIVEAQGDLLTRRKFDENFSQETIYPDDLVVDRTPAERASWRSMPGRPAHTDGPGLPDEAVRRETMYD